MSRVRKNSVKYKRCSFFVSGPGTALLTNERMVRGRKGPGYLERKIRGMNGPWNVPRRERSAVFARERTVQGTNSLENEYSSIPDGRRSAVFSGRCNNLRD